MQKRNSEKIFWFGDNCIRIRCLKHSFLLREYFLSGENMLTNSVKITDTTKTEYLELIFFQSDQKIWEKYCRGDSCSASDRLTCWLLISVMTWGFLEIKTIPIFAVYNFRKK